MHEEQTARILDKLEQARAIDRKYRVFGADEHEYRIGKPASARKVAAFEQQHGIELPVCYKAFLLNVGNGKRSAPAAGPFYGIDALGSDIDALHEVPERDLRLPPVIRPGMSSDEWQQLTQRLKNDDDLADDEYAAEWGKVFAGILPIGSQGCSYIHALVLGGEHAGRVVNIDTDLQQPIFCFERNFLDWYERWLDEIIAGILLVDSAPSFGFSMGGSADELLSLYASSTDPEQKRNALIGLERLPTLSADQCTRLQALCSDPDRKLKLLATTLLTKFSYELAVPVLSALIDGDDEDCREACSNIHHNAKKHAGDWVDRLCSRLPMVDSEPTLEPMVFILQEAKADFSSAIQPFCTHASADIRALAYYALGSHKKKAKRKLVAQFVTGLADQSPRVVHATLQALDGVDHPSLRDSYRTLIDRFPAAREADEDIYASNRGIEYYIPFNVDHRLKDLGYKGRPDFLASFAEGAKPAKRAAGVGKKKKVVKKQKKYAK